MEASNQEKIIKAYFSLYPSYLRLGENVKDALENFLIEKKIETVSVKYRIKKLDQFLEKIERKKYSNPFEQMSDICGIRIICYFQNDIKNIEEIIKKDFEIVEKENKVENSSPYKFGYRSNHFVLKIKKNWAKTPNYRGLENLKIELQVRTILMHSWAEIEHKLAYKRTEHIPQELRRKFSRISALLEEADEQFQEIHNEVDKKRRRMRNNIKQYEIDNEEINFDLDALKTLLDYYFPQKIKDSKNLRDFFDEISKSKITISDLLRLYKNKLKK